MSADNGIYITEWNDGYRVAETTSIDDISYKHQTESEEEATVHQNDFKKRAFGSSPVFKTLEAAILYAHRLESEIIKNGWFLEYGVNVLEGNFGEFPK